MLSAMANAAKMVELPTKISFSPGVPCGQDGGGLQRG
uniref:Uncharacterized protein n=1 Tax=Anguilla anguilla TaxID=7936 RepID=A0A0E9VEP4_ANGAN